MQLLEKMENVIEKENIDLMYLDLSRTNKLALYGNFNGNSVIVLDCSFKQSRANLNAVLGEELGHHFTSSGINIKEFKETYYGQLIVDRCECRAMEWAYNFLIDKKDFFKRLEIEKDMHNVAEQLGINVKFLYDYLNYLARKERFIKIDNKTIDLAILPSVCFISDFAY